MPNYVPENGVWCPSVTFFSPDTDELALDAQARYFHYLSTTGIAGIVVLGTNAEPFLLTREERKALVMTCRRAVGQDFPIMAGVGGHSTRQVLQHITDAADAGANSALLLPPAYFGTATTTRIVEAFYDDVATKSPLPIIIYNFPNVCNGVDLQSDLITTLALRHSNIVGVKLTCGSVAKITRLAAVLPKSRFAIFGGQSDFLLGGLACGSLGCIAAFANVVPRTIAEIYRLYQKGQGEEALVLHRKAALAEQSIKTGIAATKYAAAIHSAYYAGIDDAVNLLGPRRPYVGPETAVKERVKSLMEEVAEIEQALGRTAVDSGKFKQQIMARL